MKNRSDEIIYLMRTHSGHGYRHIKAELLTVFVRYEWQTNRWAMIVEPDTNEVLGWISWYNLDESSLKQVEQYGLPGCFAKNIPLGKGPHLYLSNVVVREAVPSGVFNLLVNMAKQANPHAQSVNAHLWNRDTPVWRWSSFTHTMTENRRVAVCH